tara:strand:+ start:153 stop:347 length:195 start_codon:yes stop_codon:yes gene_type:complete
VAYLMGKLKYFIPNNVITKINHAINVKIALKTKFAEKTDCILNPDIKDNDKKNKPTPSKLNTIL